MHWQAGFCWAKHLWSNRGWQRFSWQCKVMGPKLSPAGKTATARWSHSQSESETRARTSGVLQSAQHVRHLLQSHPAHMQAARKAQWWCPRSHRPWRICCLGKSPESWKWRCRVPGRPGETGLRDKQRQKQGRSNQRAGQGHWLRRPWWRPRVGAQLPAMSPWHRQQQPAVVGGAAVSLAS